MLHHCESRRWERNNVDSFILHPSHACFNQWHGINNILGIMPLGSLGFVCWHVVYQYLLSRIKLRFVSCLFICVFFSRMTNHWASSACNLKRIAGGPGGRAGWGVSGQFPRAGREESWEQGCELPFSISPTAERRERAGWGKASNVDMLQSAYIC